jgi:GAF domain-containing protein
VPEARSYDAALDRLASVLVDESTVDSVMQLVIGLAATIMVSDAASISVFVGRPGRFSTMNATDPEVVDLDGVQYDTQRGPCVHAIRSGKPVVIDLVDNAPDWPEFVAAARADGVTSIFSSPLEVRGEPRGALNLYSHRPNAINEWDHDAVAAFARSAAVVLANANALETSTAQRAGLEKALETREMIGIAKGILMEREHLTDLEAFDRLRALSQHSNRKLHDIAREIQDGTYDRGQ